MAAAPARSMVTSPWPSSRLISAWIRCRPSSCSGVATRPSAPLSRSGFRPARISSVIRRRASAQPGRVGLERADALLHQRHEVVAHPRDGRELAAVGDLVEGQPQPELPGLEAVRLLEGHHVGTHEVDEVLVLDGLLGEQQVVLAEHPGGQPAEDQPHLGAGGRPAGRGQRAGQPGRARRFGRGQPGRVEPVEVGAEQPLEAGDVGVHPAGPVGHPGPGRARRRSAARWTRPPAPRPGRSAPRTRPGAGRAGRGRARWLRPPTQPATRSAVSQRHRARAVRAADVVRSGPVRRSLERSRATSVGMHGGRRCPRTGGRTGSVGRRLALSSRRASATRSISASGTWSWHRLAMTLRSSASNP